jgi:DUF1680 family protein
MWSWRMLALNGEARYADLVERTLYNAVLVGLSLDGQSYFYQNPLESDGAHRRQPWFGCACCPPNIARTLASLPGYFYSTSEEGVWVHLYAEGQATLALLDGREVALAQQTDYPWDGSIRIEVVDLGEPSAGSGQPFSLFLRVPGWSETGVSVKVNGVPIPETPEPGSYVRIRRAWRPGDVVELELPMPVRKVAAHPYVTENAGRVALKRGPLLYCLEQVDHPGIDLRDVVLPGDAALSAQYEPDLLGGVTVLRGFASLMLPDEGWADSLYRSVGEPRERPGGRVVGIRAVPYYAWANRGAGAMLVWVRVR